MRIITILLSTAALAAFASITPLSAQVTAGQGRDGATPVQAGQGKGAPAPVTAGQGRDGATYVQAGQGKGDPTPATLMASASKVACGKSAQNLRIVQSTSARGPGYLISGLCLQVISSANGKVLWEGVRPDNVFNLPRLAYTGGGVLVRSKQPGLLAAVKLNDQLSRYGTPYVIMAQLQAGVFGEVDFLNGKLQGEFTASLYDPKTNTHTWSPAQLPTGCGPWSETAQPDDPASIFGPTLGGVNFFSPFSATLQAPEAGKVLGVSYVKIPSGRCWLGSAGTGVAGVPIAFSWGPTLPLGAAYRLENGKIVDVEEAESAQLESAMLGFGFNPGQSPLKYSGSATTNAAGTFSIPYTVETTAVGPFSVRRRGYRIGKIHKVQGGLRMLQRIDPSSPRAPNKNGDCLTGRAVVSPDGSTLDITYRFKGSSC